TYDTIQMFAAVMPANYPNYSYRWTPGTGLSDSTIQMPVFSGDASVPSMSVQVTTPIGCTGADTMAITVYPGDFLEVAPGDTGVCPPAKVALDARGADVYAWSPDWGLDDATIGN